jgi:hypothetical protein
MGFNPLSDRRNITTPTLAYPKFADFGERYVLKQARSAAKGSATTALSE